jgi:hypothetical protein
MDTNIDRDAVRTHTKKALDEAEPGFGTFFLARFLDLRISYALMRCRERIWFGASVGGVEQSPAPRSESFMPRGGRRGHRGNALSWADS